MRHSQNVIDRRRRIASPKRRFAGLEVHRPRRRRARAAALPLRITGRPQPRHQGRDFSLSRPVPPDPEEPQQPVPPQQVKPIASAGQRARVAQHEIPQVGHDRLHPHAIAVHDHERQVRRLTRDHRPDRRDRSSPIGQLPPQVFDHTTSFHQTGQARSLILTWCSQQGGRGTAAIRRRWVAVFLGGAQCAAAGEERQVGVDGFVGVDGLVAHRDADVAMPATSWAMWAAARA